MGIYQRRIQTQIRGGAEIISGGAETISGVGAEGQRLYQGGQVIFEGGLVPPWPPLGSATGIC